MSSASSRASLRRATAPRQARGGRARPAARRSGRGPPQWRWRPVGRRAAARRPRPGRRRGQRRLAAERDDDAERPFELDHVEHVLQRHRLEIEPVARVVVRRDRLRVRVRRARPHGRAGGRPAPPARSSSRTRFPGRSGSCRSRARRSLRSRSPRRRRSRARGSSTASAPRTRRRRSRRRAVPAGHGEPAPPIRDAEDPRDPRVGEAEALRRPTSPFAASSRSAVADGLDLGREVRVEAGDLRQRVACLDALERLQQRLRERAAEPERLADGAHLGPELARLPGNFSKSKRGALTAT